jgi:RNA polymerase sigma-70 factor (ECF subfamily)
MRPYLLAVARLEAPSAASSKTEAEDIVQETIVKALRRFEQFEGATVDELRGWLRRILLNGLKDSSRHWRADRRHDDREVSVDRGRDGGSGIKEMLVARVGSPLAALIRQDKIGTIQAALGQLRQEHRDVIMLRCEENLGFDAIGRRLGRSADAARKLWERALEDLKRRLQQMREEDSDFQDHA